MNGNDKILILSMKITCSLVKDTNYPAWIKVGIFWEQYIFQEISTIFSLVISNFMLTAWFSRKIMGNLTRNWKYCFWKCTALIKHWLYLPLSFASSKIMTRFGAQMTAISLLYLHKYRPSGNWRRANEERAIHKTPW